MCVSNCFPVIQFCAGSYNSVMFSLYIVPDQPIMVITQSVDETFIRLSWIEPMFAVAYYQVTFMHTHLYTITVLITNNCFVSSNQNSQVSVGPPKPLRKKFNNKNLAQFGVK